MTLEMKVHPTSMLQHYAAKIFENPFAIEFKVKER
jgi:hypothetical protein